MERGENGIVSFCRACWHHHAENDADAWWPTFLSHYLKPGLTIDEDKVAHDLATWGPIAARIAELKRERRVMHG